MPTKPVTYAAAGVDINRQDDALARIKPLVKATRTPGVRSDIGLFGGLFSAQFPEGRPVLVASMDGVGTKMKVARLAGVWDTVGADLVNHCVNDILVQGARPLFFLDYVAAQRLEPAVVEQVVQGMAGACRECGCALLGGEMAEMPGVYAEGEVDVAGTIVGVVDEPDLLPRLEAMAEGDVLVGLPSSGLHTNGYSLARKVCFELAGLKVGDPLPGTGRTVGEALLAVHRNYLAPVLPLVRERKLVAMAHITGGGLTDNLPRVLPGHLDAAIDTGSWTVPPLFRFLMDQARLPVEDARRSFNLGVGMVLIASRRDVQDILGRLADAGEAPWVLGELVQGTGAVAYR
jgi:phosphoribosylformylglycinamidine cyclo-ligase